MNAHLIRIVEGPLAGNVIAANDAVFELPTLRLRETRLRLVPAPAQDSPVSGSDKAASASTSELDDYVLGGYAGI